MKKRIISFILVFCMTVALIPFGIFSASAAKSGTVGNCTWRLEGTTLTISGNGSMGESMDTRPWGTNITELIVEEGVTNIADSAFIYCEKLKHVSLPSTLRVIGYSSFNGCTSLESITIPDGVIELGWHSFMDCHSIMNIHIPKSLVTIGIQSFDYCYSLRNISVDDENPSYTAVNGVLFNKDMTTIIRYPQAKGSHYMDSYTIPNTVERIEFHAFEGVSMLGDIRIPESVTKIESQAFYRTQAYWNSVRDGEDIFYIGDCLIEVTNKDKGSYTIKEGTRLIASGAFSFCKSMKKIAIPDGVKYIGEDAFWGCSALKAVSLPKGLTVISSNVFLQTPLQKIFFRGNDTERRNIEIAVTNDELKKATWYFDACYGSENHSWSKTTVLTQATCSLEGLAEKVCQICGAVNREKLAKAGHDYGIISQKEAPTCVSAGIEVHICKTCGYNDERYVEPTGHVFGAWREDIAPTCTEIGVMKRSCSLCDATEVQVVNAKGHDYDIFNVIKEATATEEGYKAAVCMVCGDIKTEVIPRNDVRGVISIWQGVTVAIGIVALTAIAVLLIIISRKNKKLKEE